MSNTCHDIEEMLDTLRLPKCVEKFDQMLGNPQLGSYSPTQGTVKASVYRHS